ncbi:unnamed protein product, partial [Onchocerca ochengi]|uniref:Secreted protein n=1 Tax=Onchocerca ochengi TaxID=42157 RepID=A0A182EQC9_ONCOC
MCMETTIFVSVQKAMSIAIVKLLLAHVQIHHVKMVVNVWILLQLSSAAVCRDGRVLFVTSRSNLVMAFIVLTSQQDRVLGGFSYGLHKGFPIRSPAE